MISQNEIKTDKTVWLALVFILFSFALGYWPLFQKLSIRWDSGDNSYCYLIIPLFLYLCWEKRDIFKFDVLNWNPYGLILVSLSTLLMIVGELGSVETMLYLGIWGCIVGIIFVFYGTRIRHLIFPLLILVFIVPIPPFVNRVLTFNLKLAASTLSVMLMRAAGVSVLQTGNIIDIGITQLQVVDACSGLRYFVPLILMAFLFGFFYCKRFWQKALLLVIVLPLSILVNGLRIFATGMLYIWGHPELAENFFHDFSGWLVFMAAGVVLFGVSIVLKKIGPKNETDVSKDIGVRHISAYQQLAITIVLCIIFAGSGWALQNLPSARNLPDRTSFESFPMEIGKWRAKRHYLSEEILNALWADDYVSATYYKNGSPNTVQLLIPFYEYQGTRHTAHAPQSCMLGGGWDLMVSEDRSVGVGKDKKINIRATVWKQGESRIFGAYFFYQRGRVIISPWANKFYLMWDAFIRRRTDGAVVRVEVGMAPGQSIDDAYGVLEEFMGPLWEILSDYVPI